MNNDEVEAAAEALRAAEQDWGPLRIVGDLRPVIDILAEAIADADRLAAKVRSVRLMFDAAGLHRTAEDMADVLDQHDALLAKRAAT